MVPVKGMYAPCGLRSKVVVLVMLMYWFFLLRPLFVGVLCLVFVLLFSTWCLSGYSIILMEKRQLMALLKLSS